jgi:hypothetical protein
MTRPDPILPSCTWLAPCPVLSVTSDRRWNAIWIHHLGWMDAESIGKAHEQVEKRPIVRGLSDLRVGPSHVAKRLHLFIGNAVGVAGQSADKFQQEPLRRTYRRTVQVTIAQSLCHISVLLSLQLQEPRVGTESVVAAVECRHVRRNHLMLGAGERSIRKVQARRVHNSCQEVRT